MAARVVSLPAIAFVRQRAKRRSAFSFEPRLRNRMENGGRLGQTWQLLKETFQEWWKDNTFRLSASLAFYTIFSIAPVLLIAVGIASLFLARENAVHQIIKEVQQLTGA